METDQLGPLLRRLRSRSGLTQEDLAGRSGVSVRTIRRLENGKSTDHRLGTVNLLADALEAGPEERRLLAGTLGKAGTAPVVPAPVVPAPSGPRPSPVRDALAGSADELAREVRRRWRREEEQRRVHDPFPLPVRWAAAPAGLTDHEDNYRLLEPGAVPFELDLSGEVRTVAEVYRRIDSGRLVILGRAGSGKSILTIRFALDVLEARASADPVPVIFSLGSWDPAVTELRDWLLGLLLRDHPHLARRVPSGATLAAALIDADLVLPVLDGFDEIAEGLRCDALHALNATSLPLVVTSRRGEYAEAVQAANTPLVLAAGIELAGLGVEDLLGYLPRTARPAVENDSTGTGSGPVWARVLADLVSRDTPAARRLASVLSTPLMVVLARTMYSDVRDSDPAELLDGDRFPTEHALEEHLLAGFVPTVYHRRAPGPALPHGPDGRRDRAPERALRWLGHLAHHLVRLDRDRQDLAWWQIADSLRLSTRVAVTVLVSALCIAGADWGACLLVTRLGLAEILLQGALMGLFAGLAFGSVYAVLAAVGRGVFEPSRVRLRLPGAYQGIGRGAARTFTARFGSGLLGGSVMGVGCAVAFALEHALYDGVPLLNSSVIKGTLIDMLGFGLIFGLAAGLVFGLLAVLEAPLDVTSAATPADLLSSNRATVGRQVVVLIPLLTVAIAFGGRLVTDLLGVFFGRLSWPMSDGLFIGAVGGLGGVSSYVFSFTAWGQWVVLCRVWLPLTGLLPWDTAAFLDDAYRRGVLRRAGAVYQFRHVRLQHHLGRTFREQQPAYAPARFTTGT
ncbi:helix-turn-helix domain-containing protein [Kitasatospora sp. McL0602]|uniref:helix-turn-helix domain-containing protein n=1 Tax=Kitasatospora sp. McL0602 TaxID=3439530 RepID=UPI003F8A6C28